MLLASLPERCLSAGFVPGCFYHRLPVCRLGSSKRGLERDEPFSLRGSSSTRTLVGTTKCPFSQKSNRFEMQQPSYGEAAIVERARPPSVQREADAPGQGFEHWRKRRAECGNQIRVRPYVGSACVGSAPARGEGSRNQIEKYGTQGTCGALGGVALPIGVNPNHTDELTLQPFETRC